MLSDVKTPNQPAELPLASTPGESNKTGEEDADSLELSEAASSKDILEQGTKSPRYKLSLEVVDALLGLIYETLDIKE